MSEPTNIAPGVASPDEVSTAISHIIRAQLQFLTGDLYLLNQICHPPVLGRQQVPEKIRKATREGLLSFIRSGNYTVAYPEMEAHLPCLSVVVPSESADGAGTIDSGRWRADYIREGTADEDDVNSTRMREYVTRLDPVSWSVEITAWHVSEPIAQSMMNAVEWVMRRRSGYFGDIGITEIEMTRTVDPRPEAVLLEHITALPTMSGTFRGSIRHVELVGPVPHRVHSTLAFV